MSVTPGQQRGYCMLATDSSKTRLCVAVRSLKEARPVPTGAENSTRGDDGERYQAAAGEAQQKLDILTSALSGGGNCLGT